MEDKQLEEELKKEADKLKLEDCSSRMDRIHSRIERQEAFYPQEELEKVPVFAEGGSVSGSDGRVRRRYLWLCGIAALLCAIVLVIVLPIVLKGKRDPLYADSSARLLGRVPTEEEFYRELSEVKIPTMDLANYEIETYTLWMSEQNRVRGGGVEYYDEVNSAVVEMDFYDAGISVTVSDLRFDDECITATVNGIPIRYLVTAEEEGAYILLATASYNKCNYRFNILSDNENIFAVFETLFQ